MDRDYNMYPLFYAATAHQPKLTAMEGCLGLIAGKKSFSRWPQLPSQRSISPEWFVTMKPMLAREWSRPSSYFCVTRITSTIHQQYTAAVRWPVRRSWGLGTRYLCGRRVGLSQLLATRCGGPGALSPVPVTAPVTLSPAIIGFIPSIQCSEVTK